MFASTSTHKRKRSAARRDIARKGIAINRSIVSLCKEEARGIDSSDSGREKLKQVIRSHIFNHQTNVILPFTQNIDHVLPSSENIVSYSARINLKLFFDPLFVISYIKTGTLSVLSVGNLDCDDVICIDGKGKLFLSICKETYCELGLQGQELKASKGTSGRAADRRSGEPERYVVIIDLLAPSFEPGTAGYERISSRLNAWDFKRGASDQNGSWKVVMNWCKDENSFGDKIEFPKKNVTCGSVKQVPITLSHQIVTDVWLPTQKETEYLAKGWSESIGQGMIQWAEWCNALEEQLEWASMNVLDCDCIRTFWRSDGLHSDQERQSYEPGKLIKFTYSGFLPSSLGKFIVDKVTDNMNLIPFGVIQTVGFADAPVCWSLCTSASSNMMQKSTFVPLTSSSSQSESDGMNQTGPKARRKRNKSRKKRSHINPNQQGHQFRKENSIAIASGWQIVLLPTDDGHPEVSNCIIIENIGDAQRP
ncbi:hypothetical protein L7F22_019018 [Adiantum nelumboides]|nr:hypothetical protein [Adiantum nelumboides]